MENKIQYLFNDSLINKQEKAQKEILDKFTAGNYTIEDPLIELNPYLINPLAALVLFKTNEEVAVTITVHGKEEKASLSHTYPKAKVHILPILGLYEDYENRLDIKLYHGYTKSIVIKTDKLEYGAECINIETTPEYLQDNLMFVTPVLSGLATGYDYNGDIRWQITIPTMFKFGRLKNGNIMTGTDRLMQAPYFVSGLFELDMTGKIHREYRVPGGYHHDHFEMEDGNILVLSDDLRSDTVEDICHLVDRTTGKVLKTWDYKTQIKPEEAPPSINYSLHDWFHANAIAYDKNTHSLTISGRHSDAIINIDFETGKLNWIIGDPENWPKEKQKYFFKPISKEFDWQYEQHAVVITPNGDIMCFDNGHGRSKVKEKRVMNKDNFSRGVRYAINTDDMTISQVWQYGKERGSEFFSQYICNVEYYNEGHYLIHSGGVGYHDGKTAEFMIAFDPNDPKSEQRSITVEVANDKKVFEMQLKGNFYRAKKMKLYHDAENAYMGEGKKLGKMQPTKESAVEKFEAVNEILSSDYEAILIEEDDRITFKGKFEQNQKVALVLEQDENIMQYNISTAKLNATVAGSFMKKKEDQTNTWISVNKEGLKGTYELFIAIDSKKYKTGISITC